MTREIKAAAIYLFKYWAPSFSRIFESTYLKSSYTLSITIPLLSLSLYKVGRSVFSTTLSKNGTSPNTLTKREYSNPLKNFATAVQCLYASSVILGFAILSRRSIKIFDLRTQAKSQVGPAYSPIHAAASEVDPLEVGTLLSKFD